MTTRSVTGTAAEITVTNGDGVAGAPTLSLPTALTFTGKTVTGGAFTGMTALALALGSDADGDIYYRASSTIARLAKGAANTKLFMNAGATAPEWAAGFAVVSTTWDVSTTGSLAVTGVGFKPKAVLMLAGVSTTTAQSIGFSVGANNNIFNDGASLTNEWSLDGSFISVLRVSVGNQGLLAFASFDSDGATFTKSKSGSPTGTVTAYLLFMR
jgi:hypothetical protein